MSVLEDDRPEDAERLSDSYRVEEIDRGSSTPVTRKDAWDRQIEEDLEDGKLDDLVEEAREDHRKGRTKPLP